MEPIQITVKLIPIEHNKPKKFQKDNSGMDCGKLSLHPTATQADTRLELSQSELDGNCMAIFQKNEFCFLSKR